MDCFEGLREATGICIERRVELGNAVIAFLGLLGIVSLLLAYKQLRHGQQSQQLQARATRARFVLDLNQEFLTNDAERNFFYRIDYLDFRFDPNSFAQSEDEKQLDRLLYKLSYVGKLLREGLVSLDDVNNIRHIASRTLRNAEVISYLRYLKEVQIPDHSSFSDAIFLFEKWFGTNDPAYPLIKAYLTPSSGDTPGSLPTKPPRDRYAKVVKWSEEDQAYVGSAPGLIYGGCHGPDERQVFDELCRIVEEATAIYRQDGRPLPPATAGDERAAKLDS